VKPQACLLRAEGTNCDAETFYALELAGADPRMVHVNELRARSQRLRDYQLLVIPGGFTYGDDVAAGKILAVELISFLREEIYEFVAAGKPVLGICNGFQVLVRTGLLPFREAGRVQAALIHNRSGRFECRWVRLRVEETPCVFTRGLAGRVIEMPVAHAEGRFYAPSPVMEELETRRQIVFRYVDGAGAPTAEYPANPNGSEAAVAGICDAAGTILGLMPHPERYVRPVQHPNWRRLGISGEGHGLAIFRNAVAYAAGL